MLLFQSQQNALRRGRLASPSGRSSGPQDDNEEIDDIDRASSFSRTQTSMSGFPFMNLRTLRIVPRISLDQNFSLSQGSAVSSRNNSQALDADGNVGDPLEPFAPMSTHEIDFHVQLDDIVPKVIACKIQCHHELWYRLAYGRPCDRRVSGGYGLVPTRFAGRPLIHAKFSRCDSETNHTSPWRSRLKQQPCNDSPSPVEGEGRRGRQTRVTSIDYTNAEEVVLNNTQDAEKNLLHNEDALPSDSPRFLFHPYNKRKVKFALANISPRR